MNGAIAKLFVVVVVLFALLIGWTSRWTVFDASSLTSNPLNRRTLVDDLRIKRGEIIADDGDGAREVDSRPRAHLEADVSDRRAVRAGGRVPRTRSRGRWPGSRNRASSRCADCRPG